MSNKDTIQQWIDDNLDSSQDHRSKHVLKPNSRAMSPKMAMVKNLLRQMFEDDTYNTASCMMTDDTIGLDAYIGKKLYKQLSDINEPNLDAMIKNLERYGSTVINIPMPVMKDNDGNSQQLENICLTIDDKEYTIKPEISNTIAVVINKNNNAVISKASTPTLLSVLERSHISSAYPSVKQSKPAIGKQPATKAANINLTIAMILYQGDMLRGLPVYEQMAWLTSNTKEIEDYYPNRTIYPRSKCINFENVYGETNEITHETKSYDVKFDNNGAWYRTTMPPWVRNQQKWCNLDEYQGDSDGMNRLKNKYRQMLNNDTELKEELTTPNIQQNIGMEY